jgi:hypothetical protein
MGLPEHFGHLVGVLVEIGNPNGRFLVSRFRRTAASLVRQVGVTELAKPQPPNVVPRMLSEKRPDVGDVGE